MCLDGESVLPQAETPDWRVGALGDEEPGTPASDAYKFGLLVARLFAADQQTTSVGAVPASLRRHVLACLSTEPGARRTPGEWLDPLDRQLRRTSRRRDTEQRAEPATPRTAPPRRTPAAPPRTPRPATPVWPWIVVPALLLGVCMAIASNDEPATPTIPPARLPTALYTPPLYTPPPYVPPRIDLPPLTVPLPTVQLPQFTLRPAPAPPVNPAPQAPAP
jgi:hypothetical protein